MKRSWSNYISWARLIFQSSIKGQIHCLRIFYSGIMISSCQLQQASNPCNYPAKSRGASTDFQKVDLIIDFIIALKGTVKQLTATFPYCTVCSLEEGWRNGAMFHVSDHQKSNSPLQRRKTWISLYIDAPPGEGEIRKASISHWQSFKYFWHTLILFRQ